MKFLFYSIRQEDSDSYIFLENMILPALDRNHVEKVQKQLGGYPVLGSDATCVPIVQFQNPTAPSMGS
mgnify:CR=1 FL=1